MSNTPEKSSDLTANAAKLAGKDLASGWNPLASGEQALELAMLADLMIEPVVEKEKVVVWYGEDSERVHVHYGRDELTSDIHSAVRYAIVWAASELQKAKEEAYKCFEKVQV